ncbi:hypothetical protein RF55_19123 [Lasius niger]|uniref:Uncharacterized protein n=1 Tax=Lasius niger TaxID=67767 RepID=A0A0J7K0T0_LASNI|nr:hypothetical protein RF55_19123 [Lasius niger]
MPGVLIEQVGNVMYNILLDSNRKQPLVRCHTNQLMARYLDDEDQRTDSETKLPLDLLIDEFRDDHVNDSQSEIFVTLSNSIPSTDDELDELAQEKPLEARPRKATRQPSYLNDYEL